MIAELLTNPAFAGIAGGLGAGAVLYQIRALPGRALIAGRSAFTIELRIDNSDALFDRLAIYLARSRYVQRARRLRMAEIYEQALERWTWLPTFGDGPHLIRDHGNWFLVNRGGDGPAEGNAPGSIRRREHISIISLARSQEPLRALIKRAELVHETSDAIRVFLWAQGGYRLADQKPRRSLDTVFLPAEQKQRILADLQRFTGARDLYRSRGTPWRRGYLLDGPPGTGKTTIAFAMACALNRPLHIINPATAGGDNGLHDAFGMAGAESVIVIEDIDTVAISRDRTEPAAAQVTVSTQAEVTLAGLLNAIDGLASRDGRILFITTNHAERLDPALVRPGRVDRRETIGLLGTDDAWAMTRLFMPGALRAWFDGEIAPMLPMAPAALQELLVAASET